MLRAFRWNLRVLSYISLVVGAFLIYNTISVSVVRRRAEIGILRALGAGRATVLALFLAEALLFGIVGAALGVALGRLLAGGTVRLIADTVNALYTTSRPAPVELTAGRSLDRHRSPARWWRWRRPWRPRAKPCRWRPPRP